MLSTEYTEVAQRIRAIHDKELLLNAILVGTATIGTHYSFEKEHGYRRPVFTNGKTYHITTDGLGVIKRFPDGLNVGLAQGILNLFSR